MEVIKPSSVRHTFDMSEAVRQLQLDGSVTCVMQLIIAKVWNAVEFVQNDTQRVLASRSLQKH